MTETTNENQIRLQIHEVILRKIPVFRELNRSEAHDFIGRTYGNLTRSREAGKRMNSSNSRLKAELLLQQELIHLCADYLLSLDENQTAEAMLRQNCSRMEVNEIQGILSWLSREYETAEKQYYELSMSPTWSEYREARRGEMEAIEEILDDLASAMRGQSEREKR